MADFRWPGYRITSMPFVDGAINTRYYDTLPVPGHDHDTVYDPFNIYQGDPTFDRQTAIQRRYSQFNGSYHVYYSIIGDGRPVYLRVVGEADLGVVMTVYRLATRDINGTITSGTDEPSPLYGVKGWTVVTSDPYDDGSRHWRKACAWRGILAPGEQYTIALSSYAGRGTIGSAGTPGYQSGFGQVMYFEADYDDITPRNDFRKDAKEVILYDNDRPYVSAPVLNTDYTTRDHIEQVQNIPDPPDLLDLGYTAWWRYRPKQSGTFRASLAIKDQEYFPGQYPGVLYALRNKTPGSASGVLEFVNSSRYNPSTGVPEAPYVQFNVQAGEDIYVIAGHYQTFQGVAQKYVVTATGPMSRESFSLRMKDNKWELLSGGPYEDKGLFHLRLSDNQWVHQVGSEERGAIPLKLRMKNNTWEDVLWFLPSEVERNGRYTWLMQNVSDTNGNGIHGYCAWASDRKDQKGLYSYGQSGSNIVLIELTPTGEQTSGGLNPYSFALTRSASGWTGQVGGGDYPIMERYTQEILGWYGLPLGALLEASRRELIQQGIDGKLNRVEITHYLYGYSVDKRQMPWMNFYGDPSTTNSLYPGVGAFKQLTKQNAGNYYEKVEIDGDEYMVPKLKGRAHSREDGVILWTGSLNSLGNTLQVHGLPIKNPVTFTQTLTPAFVGDYTVNDLIIYQMMTSQLPEPDPVTLNSEHFHTIDNSMNGYMGIKIIYDVPE